MRCARRSSARATPTSPCSPARLLAAWHAAARDLPPHDLLDRIVADGEYRERVAAAVPPERRVASLGAIDALLGVALTLDGARYATPYNFVRALKRRAVRVAAPAQKAAVQLLTVHGAKGLEARAVFIVDADPEPRNSESATLLIDWPVEAAQPTCCAFAYSELRCAPSLEPVRDREFAARRREELNALYVAMSRARERLVFSATEPYRPGTETTWWQRIEGLAAPWRERDGSPVAAVGLAATVALGSLPRWNHEGADVPAPNVRADADDSSRLGQAVHRVLEWAAAGAPDGDRLQRMADAAAREFDVSGAQVGQLAARIWSSAAAARFLRGPALRWAGNEVTVSEGGEILRIDRLVELDEAGRRVWWVLDYKLQHAPAQVPAYREQLRRYVRGVRALQPGATVRCAFVTGEGEVVEIDAEADGVAVRAHDAIKARN